jgi:hypothetical protein
VIKNVPLFCTPFLYPSSILGGFDSGARLTRLTKGFSKKCENLKAAACALHFASLQFLSDSFIDQMYPPPCKPPLPQ